MRALNIIGSKLLCRRIDAQTSDDCLTSGLDAQIVQSLKKLWLPSRPTQS